MVMICPRVFTACFSCVQVDKRKSLAADLKWSYNQKLLIFSVGKHKFCTSVEERQKMSMQLVDKSLWQWERICVLIVCHVTLENIEITLWRRIRVVEILNSALICLQVNRTASREMETHWVGCLRPWWGSITPQRWAASPSGWSPVPLCVLTPSH